jgi:hypothetical protein
MLVASSIWVRIHQNVHKMYCSTEWWSCIHLLSHARIASLPNNQPRGIGNGIRCSHFHAKCLGPQVYSVFISDSIHVQIQATTLNWFQHKIGIDFLNRCVGSRFTSTCRLLFCIPSYCLRTANHHPGDMNVNCFRQTPHSGEYLH